MPGSRAFNYQEALELHMNLGDQTLKTTLPGR
jgi:hypothetical protein